MTTSATLTLGFLGAGYDSVWFTPLLAPEGCALGEELFTHARQARTMAKAMIEAGCAMAAAAEPHLAVPLSALSASPLSMSFFDYPDEVHGLGWFRIHAEPAPGSTPEALAACERALAASNAPLLSAKAEGGLLAFASGLSDEVPAPFRAAASQASERVTQSCRLTGVGSKLASADAFVLLSADGSKTLSVCAASAASSADPLGDLKTFAKLAQSGMEARGLAGEAPGAKPFFDALDHALGANPDSPPMQRRPVAIDEGAFFPVPAHLRVVVVEGLPSEGFDALAKLFLQSVAKRFGTIAANPRLSCANALRSPALSVATQASLSGLFSKLPPAPTKTLATLQQASPSLDAPSKQAPSH